MAERKAAIYSSRLLHVRYRLSLLPPRVACAGAATALILFSFPLWRGLVQGGTAFSSFAARNNVLRASCASILQTQPQFSTVRMLERSDITNTFIDDNAAGDEL